MDCMDLKTALLVAGRYADAKGTDRYHHLVRMTADAVSATNGISGCRVPVTTPLVDANVPLVDLKRVVGGVRNPEFEYRGTTLHVNAGGSSFKIRAIDSAKLPDYPVVDAGVSFHAVSANKMAALAALAEVAGDDTSHGLNAVRLSPEWAAVATQSFLIVVRASTGLDEAISVPAAAFKGLSGDGRLAVYDNKLWIEDPGTGQSRWAQALSTPWPDQVVEQMLPDAKADGNRVSATISLADFKGLSDRAQLLMDGDEFGSIEINNAVIIKGSFGRGVFSGEASVQTSPAPTVEKIGVSPCRLATVLGAMAVPLNAAGKGDNLEVSFAGGSKPILLLSDAVEAMLMPSVLP